MCKLGVGYSRKDCTITYGMRFRSGLAVVDKPLNANKICSIFFFLFCFSGTFQRLDVSEYVVSQNCHEIVI